DTVSPLPRRGQGGGDGEDRPSVWPLPVRGEYPKPVEGRITWDHHVQRRHASCARLLWEDKRGSGVGMWAPVRLPWAARWLHWFASPSGACPPEARHRGILRGHRPGTYGRGLQEQRLHLSRFWIADNAAQGLARPAQPETRQPNRSAAQKTGMGGEHLRPRELLPGRTVRQALLGMVQEPRRRGALPVAGYRAAYNLQPRHYTP